MKRNMLKDLVNEIISIDEYDAKAGSNDEVIVVAFTTEDRGPADDLNRFIQRGHLNILDSDVSPNPNEFGQYLVFVEFKRNNAFLPALYELVTDIENLTSKQKWKVQYHKIKQLFDLMDPQLKNIIRRPEDALFTTDVQDLLSTADSEVTINESVLILSGFRNKVKGNIISTTDNPAAIIKESAFKFEHSFELGALKDCLGSNWSVSKYGTKYVLESAGNYIILDDVELQYN
jgi:hypothetical protein